MFHSDLTSSLLPTLGSLVRGARPRAQRLRGWMWGRESGISEHEARGKSQSCALSEKAEVSLEMRLQCELSIRETRQTTEAATQSPRAGWPGQEAAGWGRPIGCAGSSLKKFQDPNASTPSGSDTLTAQVCVEKPDSSFNNVSFDFNKNWRIFNKYEKFLETN